MDGEKKKRNYPTTEIDRALSKQRRFTERRRAINHKAMEVANEAIIKEHRSGKRGKNKLTVAKEKAMYDVFYDYFKNTYLEKMKSKFDKIVDTQAEVAAKDFGHQDRRMVMQAVGLLGAPNSDNQSKVETAGKLLAEIFGDDQTKQESEYEKE